MNKLHTLYTLGYSSFYNLDDFLARIKDYKIDAIVDARGRPGIATFERYRDYNLKPFLQKNGVHYLSFAREFGVRPTEDRYYTDNAVDFDKIAKSEAFKSGCKRIRNGLEKYAICLMCAQKNPADCHRAILITHALEKLYPEMEIRHILPDSLITQRDVDEELKKRYALFEGSLEACYKIHGKSIAYRRK